MHLKDSRLYEFLQNKEKTLQLEIPALSMLWSGGSIQMGVRVAVHP